MFTLLHFSHCRECPEECKEAVASLMVAAARFSDLPELRDIRQLFQERYANSLDYCVDQKASIYARALDEIYESLTALELTNEIFK